MKKACLYILIVGLITAVATFAADGKKPAELGKVDDAGVREMTLKQLGYFDYDEDKGGGIPADVTALEGKKVRLRGFMMVTTGYEAMTEFALIPELFGCCYGSPPRVHQMVTVSFPKGKGVDFIGDEVLVEGVLHVKEERHDGYTTDIFKMDGVVVKSVKK